jgi:hypothetical protein
MTLQLQIRREVGGTWSVHGLSPESVTGLPSLSASIDYARRQCGAAPATLELMIDGFYAVVQQEMGWPRQLVAPAKEPALQTLGGVNAETKPVSTAIVPLYQRPGRIMRPPAGRHRNIAT